MPKQCLDSLEQAWATSGPRATYGPPSILMWPASYIWSFLNSYFDYENTLNIKKVPVLLQKRPYNLLTWACTGPRIPNLSLMWPAKTKELPTPALEGQTPTSGPARLLNISWTCSRSYKTSFLCFPIITVKLACLLHLEKKLLII